MAATVGKSDSKSISILVLNPLSSLGLLLNGSDEVHNWFWCCIVVVWNPLVLTPQQVKSQNIQLKVHDLITSGAISELGYHLGNDIRDTAIAINAIPSHLRHLLPDPLPSPKELPSEDDWYDEENPAIYLRQLKEYRKILFCEPAVTVVQVEGISIRAETGVTLWSVLSKVSAVFVDIETDHRWGVVSLFFGDVTLVRNWFDPFWIIL